MVQPAAAAAPSLAPSPNQGPMQALPPPLQAQVLPTHSLHDLNLAYVRTCRQPALCSVVGRRHLAGHDITVFAGPLMGQSVHGAHQLPLLLQAPIAPVAGQAPPRQPSLAQGAPPVQQQLPAPVVPHQAPPRPAGDNLPWGWITFSFASGADDGGVCQRAFLSTAQ